MPIFRFRKEFGILLALGGAILLLSYGFAGYLLYKRNRVPPASPRLAGRTAHEILAVAESHLKNRKVEQALLAYRGALALDPQSVRAQIGLAEGELRAGREELAAREYERVLRLDSANATALLQLARIYSHQRKTWPQSELKFRQYLAGDPAAAPARLGLATVLAWQGKAQEAASIYSRPDVARLMTLNDYADYASTLVKLDRLDQAEPLLKKLLASRPKDTSLQLQLAGIYAKRKDWDSALPLYRSLLAENPNDPQVNFTYGLGLLSARNYPAALSPLRKARDAMPSSGEAGLGYARALKGAGNLGKAVDEYDRVFPHFSHDASLIREYADVLLEKKQYGKAASYYEIAHRRGLQDDRLLMGLAGALSGQRKYKAALPYLEEAYRRAPTQRTAFELAKVLRKLGRNEQALQLLHRVDASHVRRSRF